MSMFLPELTNKAREVIKRFGDDQKGTILILFAVTLTFIVTTTGVALDYYRARNVSSTLSDAIDAAALVVGKKMFQGERNIAKLEQIAKSIIDANINQRSFAGVEIGNIHISPDFQAQTARLDMDARVTTSLLKIADIDTIDVGASAETNFARKTVEFAMMLDITGSMGGQKLEDLKAAAINAVNILLPKNTPATEYTRISLAPYAMNVNAGFYADYVTQGESQKCVIDREGEHQTTDKPPREYPLRKSKRGCSNASIVPLINDRDYLIKEINGLTAGGGTAGHLGIAWAWYTLSPLWDGVWPQESHPNPFHKKDLLKIAVLMTDGEFNMPSPNESSQRAEALCKNMRNDGIRVYSVAFQAPESARELLQGCVTEDSMYFDASSAEELNAAFVQIATDVIKLRISK